MKLEKVPEDARKKENTHKSTSANRHYERSHEWISKDSLAAINARLKREKQAEAPEKGSALI